MLWPKGRGGQQACILGVTFTFCQEFSCLVFFISRMSVERGLFMRSIEIIMSVPSIHPVNLCCIRVSIHGKRIPRRLTSKEGRKEKVACHLGKVCKVG